jgi:hypothetical protein
VTKLEELEAALAKAEAALGNAVINASTVDADRAEANANLEKARADCRRVRAALIELNRSKPTARSGEELDILIRQLLEVSKLVAGASPTSRPLSEHPVRRKNNRSQDESRRQEPVHGFNIGFLAQEPSPRDALAIQSLIRQTIALSALTLAFLQYYYLDVQLQILSLPSNFPGPLQ